MQQLVANAVGLDPKRGDSVQVDKLPFDTAAIKQAQQELTKAESAQKQAQYIDLGKKAGIVLAILVIGFLLLRRGSKGGGPTVETTASDLPGGGLLMPPGTAPALGPGTRTLAALPSGEYAGAAGVIGQDQIRRPGRALVDNQPDEVAQHAAGLAAARRRPDPVPLDRRSR